MTKTHAIRFHQAGGPEVLKWEEVEIGAPGPGEALLRHTAIGLNYVDTYQRTGLYPVALPFVPGNEAVGVVEAVGPGVTTVKVGERVGYGTSLNGWAYAEKRIMPADRLVSIPDGVDDALAAATILKGLTVYALLYEVFPVTKGTTVLIHAAAGGVGTIFTQWAKHVGATVIGTVGSEEKAALARGNGCDHVINYTTEDFAARVKEITGGKLCDVAYDSVAKDVFPKTLDCIRPRGLWCLFGQSSGKVPPFDMAILMQKGSLYATRMTMGTYMAQRPALEKAAAALFQVLKSGVVKAAPKQQFKLAEAAEAHRALEGRKTKGASVLIP